MNFEEEPGENIEQIKFDFLAEKETPLMSSLARQVKNISPSISEPKVNMRIPMKQWGNEQYTQLTAWTQEGILGEEMMRRCNIQRRDLLKARIIDAQERGMEALAPKWVSCGNETRSLRQLQIAKDGSLRISALQFKRIGKTQVKEHDCFALTPTDGGFILKHYPKTS